MNFKKITLIARVVWFYHLKLRTIVLFIWVHRLNLYYYYLTKQLRFGFDGIVENATFATWISLKMNFTFYLTCPTLRTWREKYIKIYYTLKHSVYKVIELLSTSNTKEMYNLGKYFYYANKHRTLNVNNKK